MAIEKALSDIGPAESMETEVNELDLGSTPMENPEGSVEFIYDEELGEESEILHDENLVPYMVEEDLTQIGGDVIHNWTSDRESRKDWYGSVSKGFGILGIGLDTSTGPFEGSCTASHPLILEAATKFQSKASSELMPAKGPVHSQILGKITPEKEEQAKRTKDFLNYQLVHKMEEYFEETEKMLLYLALVGSGFKKTYWDGTLDRPVSEFIPVENFDVAYNAKSLKTASRYTHTLYLSENEYKKRARNGLYDESVDLGAPDAKETTDVQDKIDQIAGVAQGNTENSEVYTILEQHVDIEVPVEAGHPAEMEGIALPYIVTVDKATEKVVAIRKNWEEEDLVKYEKIVWFTHYQFVPGLGFYGLGYIHLLGNLQMTLTTALRSLVDSGQFANMQGGFKSKSMRIKDDGPISPGEFKEVEAAGQKLSELILPLPAKEPSVVLFQMLEHLTAAGQKFADSSEQVIADSKNYGAVGTTMALLEASTKFFTAIHKRLHNSQKHELKILSNLFFMYLPEEGYVLDVVGGEIMVQKADFDGRVDVLPVSDPNLSSQSQRVVKAESLLEMALRSPEIHNLREAYKGLYVTMGVDDIDKILPPPPEAKPLDPLGDILAAVNGQPIKAFQGQAHDAHIQFKTMWLQDPANGANEVMIKTMPVIEANIREHTIVKFQEQIMGISQEAIEGNPQAQQDPNMVAMIQAQAGQQVAQANEQSRLNGELESVESRMVAVEEKSLIIKANKDDDESRQKDRELDIKAYSAEVKAKADGVKMALEGQKIDLGDKSADKKMATDIAKTKIVAKAHQEHKTMSENHKK